MSSTSSDRPTNEDGKAIDPAGFEALERSTGIAGFRLDDDSRHRLEWALFWARTSQAKKTNVDVANLIVELAVQYARAANASVVAADAAGKAAKAKDAANKSFFDFVKNAVAFVPEAGRLPDAELEQHIRRALATARRQKDDPNSKMPAERRDELHLALGK
jgi:hypothetical protein